MAFWFHQRILVYFIILVSIVTVVMTATSGTSMEEVFHGYFFEIGRLWWRAASTVVNYCVNLAEFDLSAISTYFKLLFLAVFAKWYYGFFLRPLNRVRKLGDLGYVPEGNYTMQEMANLVQKRRLAGHCPPVYPNGWFCVLESRDLAVSESKAVSCLGLNLAVFRGEDGRAHVLDAYCPHMGANIAVGGQVKGDCLECPFHGWQFRGDDGKCTVIPYAPDLNIPEQAKVKSYNTLERNGFIFIWYHAEGNEPDWEPIEVDEITRGEWAYFGRTEHIINAHIEEVPENGADVAHLGHLHSPGMVAGVDLRFTYSKLWSWFKHNWDGVWTVNTDPSEKHIGTLDLKHSLNLFGKDLPILDLRVKALQIGPGIVHMMFESTFGRGAFLQVLTPEEPLKQRMIHHCYMQWYMPTILGKFFLFSEALQVERDVMIWNNKRYENKPMFVKSHSDTLIAKHRRWYSQFYSEHSPKLHFQKDTLDF